MLVFTLGHHKILKEIAKDRNLVGMHLDNSDPKL